MLGQGERTYHEENSYPSSSASSSSRLFSSATLPRTSMKRPHSLSNEECCSTTSRNTMDHFKSIRSGRPRSRTMEGNIRAISNISDDEPLLDELILQNTSGNNNKGHKFNHDSSSRTEITEFHEVGDNVGERALVRNNSCALRDDETFKSSDTGKFGTLLAAFNSTKRRPLSSSLSSTFDTVSVARPLTISVDSSKVTSHQSSTLAKSSISFPSCSHGYNHQQAGPSKIPNNNSNTGSLSVLSELDEDAQHGAHIPTVAEREQFQRSLDSATALVFHRRNGLPLTSSPAPIRKSGTCFDFDSSLTSVNAIKKALFEKDSEPRHFIRSRQRASRLSFSTLPTSNALLGNFEESVLNGRLEPASIVHGFSAEIGASGSFVPPHRTLPVTVFFYTLYDTDKGDKLSGSPYLGHIGLGPKGYHVPRTGTVQVTLFNPNGTVVKMFVVRYDLSDMPPNSRTFLRQRTLFMPNDATEHDSDSRKWLRYLIHLRFQSSKSGRIRLHTDLRVLVFQKHDLDVATLNGGAQMELRSFVQMPSNPKYSKNLKN